MTYKKDFIFNLNPNSTESIVYTLREISWYLIDINRHEAFNDPDNNDKKFTLKVSLENKTIYQRKLEFSKNPKEFTQTLYLMGCSLINSYKALKAEEEINLTVQVDI